LLTAISRNIMYHTVEWVERSLTVVYSTMYFGYTIGQVTKSKQFMVQ
jgi:hypothetical protein